MATTGLADAAASKFDATTPPKPSLLPAGVGKLLVNLDSQVSELKGSDYDIEGVMDFQRAANYL